MWLVLTGDVLTNSVTLRKETVGLGSEEGREPVAWTGTLGMFGLFSQIDDEPKAAGEKIWLKVTIKLIFKFT